MFFSYQYVEPTKLSKEMLWKGKKAIYHAIESKPISSFYAVAQLTEMSSWTRKGKRFGGR